eukprot:m.87838 g.87838  ORF g.87838 m.87838 type:complete len:841 (+) comp21425_c0_seq2:168-2690(+)
MSKRKSRPWLRELKAHIFPLLEEKKNIHVDDVVQRLRQDYPKHARKQLGPFRKSVEEALAAAKQDLMAESRHAAIAQGLEPDSELDEEDFLDLDPEQLMIVTERSGNALNRQLQTKYKQLASTRMSLEPSPSESQKSEPSTPVSQQPAPKRKPKSESRKPKRRKTTRPSRSPSPDPFTAGQNFEVPTPNIRYADLGGIESCMQEVRELVELMFTHIELFTHLGSSPPRGVLLHGPPGCGKTMLAHAIAGELSLPFLKVSAPALIGGNSGDSERSIRSLFDQAVTRARASERGCLVFIDEIDVITPKREHAQREMERRIVAQLLTSLDEITLEKTEGKPVLVIGATNRPDALDAALRRAGRFDREICMGVPDKKARKNILLVLCQRLRLEGNFDFDELARLTPGYVGADLTALVNEAALLAVSRVFQNAIQDGPTTEEENRDESTQAEPNNDVPLPGDPGTQADGSKSFFIDTIPEALRQANGGSIDHREAASDHIRSQQAPFTPEQLSPLFVSVQDFMGALKRVQPSAKREGFAIIPEVTWADVGALDKPRRELEEAITIPLLNPSLCQEMGMTSPPGVLLFGPPGCGKTLLAKAVANSSAANFISVKGPELLNKFVGESERAVRQVFQRARTSSPCVVFFDELDALCPRRGDGSSSRVTERIVNQLLTEIDGFDESSSTQVFVIGATNRPDIIDPAMLRPGRLDKFVYVDIPNAEARYEILQTHARKVTLDGVDLRVLANDTRCEGFSGADLAALVRESSIAALRRVLEERGGLHTIVDPSLSAPSLASVDFDVAFSKVLPSVSKADLRRYQRMLRTLRGIRDKPKPASDDSLPPAADS